MFNLSDYPALAEHCAQAEIGYTFIVHHFAVPLKEIGDALRAKWPDRRYLLKRLDTGDGFFDVRVTRMHFHAPSEDESPVDMHDLAHKFSPLSSEFAEDGGYDCMTHTILIASKGVRVAEIDLRNFGQEETRDASPNTRSQAQELATLIVNAVNVQAATATDSPTGPAFTDRELATVLHSLRILQEIRNNEFIGGCWDRESHHIADPDSCDHFAEAQPLTNDEIDGLCDRINFTSPTRLDIPALAEKLAATPTAEKSPAPLGIEMAEGIADLLFGRPKVVNLDDHPESAEDIADFLNGRSVSSESITISLLTPTLKAIE